MTATCDAPPPDAPTKFTAAPGDGGDPLGAALAAALDDVRRSLDSIAHAHAYYGLTVGRTARALTRVEDLNEELGELIAWLEDDGSAVA